MNAFLRGALSNLKKQITEKIKGGVGSIKSFFSKSQVEEIKQQVEYLQPNGEILVVVKEDGQIMSVSKYPARYYEKFLEQDLELYSMKYKGQEHLTFVDNK